MGPRYTLYPHARAHDTHDRVSVRIETVSMKRALMHITCTLSMAFCFCLFCLATCNVVYRSFRLLNLCSIQCMA